MNDTENKAITFDIATIFLIFFIVLFVGVPVMKAVFDPKPMPVEQIAVERSRCRASGLKASAWMNKDWQIMSIYCHVDDRILIQ